MAIAFDNIPADTSSGAGTTSLTSASWAIAGANRALIGGIGTGDSANTTHTGMKWRGSAGDALTAVTSGNLALGTHGRVSAWRLIAPSAETNTLYGNWGATQGEAVIGGASYTGVDQTTPVGTAVTGTGNTDASGSGTATATVTTAVGDWVVAIAFVHNTLSATNPTIAPQSGQSHNERYNVPGTAIGGFAAFTIFDKVATGTSTAMRADVAAADLSLTGIIGIVAFVMNAASASGSLMGSCLYVMP